MIGSQKKSFVLTALALAPTVWMLSFNYGVYKTVFYEHLFVVWAISLAALICGFVFRIDDENASFSTWRGRLLLSLPTIWVLSGYWSHLEQASTLLYWLGQLLTIATILFSLPYILYYVVIMLVPGAEMIYSTKLLTVLFLITVVIGGIGFSVGHYHPQFLYCENFEVAGNKVPKNCWPKSKGIDR